METISDEPDLGDDAATLAVGAPRHRTAPSARSHPRVRVLYIAGWQRSGSTILANVLGQLDGFCSTGELYYLWDYGWSRNHLCGCGRPFRTCSLWRDVVRRAYGEAGPPDAERMRQAALWVGRTRLFVHLALPWARAALLARLEEYLHHLGHVYRAIADATGDAVIVDSSKWPSYGRLLGALPGVKVSVVHLVRDARAVAHSWQRGKLLPDRDPPEHMRRGALESALRWNAWNVASEVYWGDARLLLRYEDFVRRPAAAVERIVRFLGLPVPCSPFRDGHTLDLRPTHTVSGNPVRLRSGPTVIREDDAWRSHMSACDRTVVTATTFPLLTRYGYLRP